VAVMLLAGRAFLPRLLAAAMKAGSGEVLIVLSAAVALGAAAATSALGFSAELGAFLAGFLLASTTFRYQIAGQLMPMRDLFMAVFFTTVGLELDMLVIGSHWLAFFPALALFLVVKFAVSGLAAWGSGATAPTALLTAAALANAGEFSIVLLASAGAAGVVSDSAEAFVVALIVCSLLLAPIAMDRSHGWAERLAAIGPAPWIRRAADRARTPRPRDDAPEVLDPTAGRHVIIGGYGVVGRFLADRFAAADIPFTVIELNPATVRKQTRLGRSIVFGDVGNREVLESAGIRTADAVVLTVPDEEAMFRACPVVRQLAPSALIAARVSYLSQAMVLTTLGADLVIVEEVATAEAMANQVLSRLAAYQQDKAVGPA
jgi:monovalent cation:H+ antiporter-2, CPA2 family